MNGTNFVKSSVTLVSSDPGDNNGTNNHAFDVTNDKRHQEEYGSIVNTGMDRKLPINSSGLLSYLCLSWLSPLIWKMYKNRSQPVSENDMIWECSDEEGVVVNTKRLKDLWSKELNINGEQKSSFFRVWMYFIGTRTLVTLCLFTLIALAKFATSAFLLQQIVAYIENSETNLTLGLSLTAAMFCCEIVRAFSFNVSMQYAAQTGTRFTSGFMGVMYDKLLKMKSINGKTNSEIINIFSLGSSRVYMATWFCSFLLLVPIYVIISTIYLYILIGYWGFITIGTFTFCYLGQIYLTKYLSSTRTKSIMYTDLRVRRMGEILKNMKFIKMFAWEKPFNDAIKDVRQSEQKHLLRSNILTTVNNSIVPITPTIASVVTITMYTAAGNDLTASTVFAVIGTMNFIRIIVALIPMSLRGYGEAKVSFARVKKLLLMEEYTPPSNETLDSNNVVEIKGADFAWEEGSKDARNETDVTKKNEKSSKVDNDKNNANKFSLTNINLEIKRGKLVGVCGSVGSGKSSLMSAIMGRMIQNNGHLAVKGDIAYVAQRAWIFNATLKENILCGRDFIATRYNIVINMCGLGPDLKLLTHGDDTEIGERGINLSGGQKQRVSLARAVYSQSDIFILDDPLSALDVKVGKQIFHTCIQGLLKDKTVLLVTHQLQYLKFCDEVILMDGGTIEEKGPHGELMTLDGLYTEMCTVFDKTSMRHKVEEASSTTETTINTKTLSLEQLCEHNDSNSTKPVELNEKSKGKLVLPEETAIGNIGFDTYNAYIRAAGGWFVAFLVLFIYFAAAASLVFSDWWLSEWITSFRDATSGSQHGGNNTSSSNATDIVTPLASNYSGSQEQIPQDNIISYEIFFNVYFSSLAGIILLQLIKCFVGAKASIVASNRLHSLCLDKVTKAPMVFFESTPTGRILNRFSKDLDESDVYLPNVTNAFLQISTTVIIALAMAIYVIPWIAIALVPVAFVFFIMKEVSKVSVRQLKRLENISMSPLLSHVTETTQGLQTIVSYKEQDRFYDKFAITGGSASVSTLLLNSNMGWIGLRLDLVSSVITVSASLILVLSKGLISPASGGLVLNLCGKTVALVNLLVKSTNETEARFSSIERLRDYYMSLTSEPQHAEKTANPEWPAKGCITYKDVVMRYRSDVEPALSHVSFDIKASEKVGVVGRTGAGKSSLVACLFRLVELSEGNIFVDGEDISLLDIHVIRSKISTITQEPVLFNGTIRYNLDPFACCTDDMIWEALEKVHMKEKIALNGLDTVLEDDGDNLSAGERQLICLARTLLRKNKILVLDEATANIDTSTDAMIQETIKQCFSDCTVITIAHRLNTVLDSDKIIVLDSGQVTECGSPQDLLSNPHSVLNSLISTKTSHSHESDIAE